jgi:hypothetical protein
MLRRTAFFVVGCGSRLSNRAKNELRQDLQSVLLVSLHCAASRDPRFLLHIKNTIELEVLLLERNGVVEEEMRSVL